MAEFTMRTIALPGPSRRLSKATLSIITDYIDDADTLFNIDLILSEACANVVRHAYRDMEPGDLLIELNVEESEYLEIRVSDWGKGIPFTPADIRNAHPEAEGGRGLFIMSTLANTFDIVNGSGQNTIYLKLILGEDKWKTSV